MRNIIQDKFFQIFKSEDPLLVEVGGLVVQLYIGKQKILLSKTLTTSLPT